MKKKPPAITDAERSLFRETVGDVRPLQDQGRVIPDKKRKFVSPKQRREMEDQQVLQDTLSDPIDLSEFETGEELLFSRSGVQPTIMKRLRKGHYAIEAELDLHRMTSDEARSATSTFLQSARQSGKRCLRIIHGKGLGSPNKLPVLKTKLNYWLQQRDDVLAFCSARPVDGGTGAVYVLLKALR